MNGLGGNGGIQENATHTYVVMHNLNLKLKAKLSVKAGL